MNQTFSTLYYKVSYKKYLNKHSPIYIESNLRFDKMIDKIIKILNNKSINIQQYQYAYDDYFGQLIVNEKDITNYILDEYLPNLIFK